MKTGTHLNSSPAVSAHSLPSRPPLRVRTGQADALPQLSFRALFADLKPGAFEEMSKKTLALRDEQARIDRARRQQQPREQDHHHAPMPEPSRSPATVERARDSSPVAKGTRASDRQNASRSTEHTDVARATTRQASGTAERETTRAADTADRARAPEQVHAPAETQPARTSTASAQPQPTSPQSTGQGPGETAGLDASETADAVDTTDLPQAVADALAYIEAQHARQGGASAGMQAASAEAAPASAHDVDTALPAETALMEGQTPAAEPETSMADAGRQVLPAAAGKTAEPALASASTAAEAAEGDAPQALSTLMDGSDTSDTQGREGRKRQTGHPVPGAAQVVSTGAGSTAGAVQTAGLQPTASAARSPEAPSAPSAGGERFNLNMMGGAGRAEAPSVGVALPVQAGHSPTRSDGSPLLSSRIDAGIHTQEFREQFARQVAGLTVQGQDRAEIRLTPAELGPIRIRVSLSADDAQLDISAAQASTRAAIEASMSTLRQMLSEQGIRLAEYRMDNGQNPAFAQNRQTGQDLSSNLQQNGAAFGQGNGAGQPGNDGTGARSTGRGSTAGDSGPVAGPGKTGGAPRGSMTTGNGRVDLFA